MHDTKLQKRSPSSIKEKGQYLLAFGVVGAMLLAANFPIFVIFFFAIFAYFLFRMFSSGSRNDTREIFEFYLSANEILRDDGRNWFGFEVRDAIAKGESIASRMSGAPPLLHFALGALYNKAGEHQAAINSLTQVIESENGNEAAYVYPTAELRNYVKVLRKIEREPAEAPLTSASIRSLERARRLRGKAILEESRAAYREMTAKETVKPELAPAVSDATNGQDDPAVRDPVSAVERADEPPPTIPGPRSVTRPAPRRDSQKRDKRDPYANRKPITEVLHDIYDKNVQ